MTETTVNESANNINFNFSAKSPGEIRLGNHNADREKIWEDWLEKFEWYSIVSDWDKQPAENRLQYL